MWPCGHSADPSQPPGEGWEWRGKGPPGSKEGSWYKPGTGEYWRPDPTSPKHRPHVDYRDPSGREWRIYPDGKWEPKR